jgi:hypothetical protein
MLVTKSAHKFRFRSKVKRNSSRRAVFGIGNAGKAIRVMSVRSASKGSFVTEPKSLDEVPIKRIFPAKPVANRETALPVRQQGDARH